MLEPEGLNHFAGRRERVLARLEGSMMLLPAAPQLYRSRDTEVPYRADSELFYLTGCVEPEAVAVLGPGVEEGPFILFVRPRDPEAERWAGKRPGPEEARELFGADMVYPLTELEQRLGKWMQTPRAVHFRFGANQKVDALVSAALSYGRARGARTGTGPRTLIDPGVILDEMRLIKDAVEVEALRAAASISMDAFRAAISAVKPGKGEWEIQALLDGGFRAGGADGPAFETIVGAGENGCVLHYVENSARIAEGDLVLIDAGATLGMYAADITRTVPANAQFTEAQRALYDVVDAARLAAIEASRPGNTTSDVHDAALAVLAQGLVGLGAVQGTPEDVVAAGGYRAYFPHQTSHWLGLDVHDVGDYAEAGEPRVLEPGMVFTIEPGLYFAPEVCPVDMPAGLVGLGIRLEDDIHVTSADPEVLTAALPVSADQIQDMMA